MDNPQTNCVAGPIPMDVDPPGEGLWDYPTPPSLAAPLHPNVEDVGGPPNPASAFAATTHFGLLCRCASNATSRQPGLFLPL